MIKFGFVQQTTTTGRTTMTTTTTLSQMLSSQDAEQPARRPARRIRNYKAMGDAKLQQVSRELFHRGEAHYRSLEKGSGDPEGDYRLCVELLNARGL